VKNAPAYRRLHQQLKSPSDGRLIRASSIGPSGGRCRPSCDGLSRA
jgi:hypothetical protein